MLPLHIAAVGDRINIVSEQFHSYVGSPPLVSVSRDLELQFDPDYKTSSKGIKLVIDVKMDNTP